MRTKPRIIYIAGYGRSGSSALSRALSDHPSILSAGELGRLSKYIENDLACTCGQPVSDCPVWSVAKTGSVHDIAKAATAAGFDVICDSSKTAYYDFLRPLAYRREGYDVTFVHLVRPLSGVLASVKKGTNKEIERGKSKGRTMHLTRTVAGYFFANVAASIDSFFFRKRMKVMHSDMIADIGSVRERIYACARLTMQEAHEVSVILEVGRHEIAGNRLLRSDRGEHATPENAKTI